MREIQPPSGAPPAQGSLTELRAGLAVAAAWQYVAREEIERADALLDRVAAMTWRRLRPRR